MSSAKSGSGHSFRMSDGDWICEDQNCQNINFARRVNCNICGKEKPVDSRLKDKEDDKKRKIGHEIGKAAADKSKGLFSADDWQCGRCGNVNWARRTTCNMCSAPKFGDNEERTGLGGGYNEREEHVEYIEREDSDDEWDDFGRKKKRIKRDNNTSDDSKYKSQTNSSKNKDKGNDSTHHKTDHNSEEEDEEDDGSADVSKYKLESDEEEDDDQSADVSKYKLESDEEEEEEEDDGDEDLSKYDLSDCIEDKK